MAQLTAVQVAALALGAGLTPDRAVTAVAVAKPESGYRTDARLTTGREDSVGIWQINTLAHRWASVTDMMDPAKNAAAMARVSSGGTNWQPWTGYTSGKYRAHLPQAREAVAAAAAGNTGGITIPLPGPLPDVNVPNPLAGVGEAITSGVDRLGEDLLVGGVFVVFTVAALALIVLGLARATGAGSLLPVPGLRA